MDEEPDEQGWTDHGVIQSRHLNQNDVPQGVVMAHSGNGLIIGREDLALLLHAVNRLPDYEAAVEALERLVGAWDAHGCDTCGATGVAFDWPDAVDVRAALARLRESVPAS